MKNIVLGSLIFLCLTAHSAEPLPIELNQEEIQNFARGLKVAFTNSMNLGLIKCEASGTLSQGFNMADAADSMAQVTTDVGISQIAPPFEVRNMHAFIPAAPKYGLLEMSLVLTEKDTQIKSLEILNRSANQPNNQNPYDPNLSGNIVKGRVAPSQYVGRLICQSTLISKDVKK